MHRRLQSRSVLLVVLAGLCVVGSARIAAAQFVEAQPAVMIYPADGEIIDTVRRPFEWTPGFALATIRIRVSLYPSAESTGQPFVFDSGAIGATSVAMPASLPRGQTLYVTLTSQAQASGISFTRNSTFYVSPTAAGPCSYALTASRTAFPYTGGTGTLTITTDPGCAWTATANPPGSVSFRAPDGREVFSITGTGSGSLVYVLGKNGSMNPISATVTVGGRSVTVTWEGTPCTFYADDPRYLPHLLTFGAGGGPKVARVFKSAYDCPVPTSATVPWLTTAGPPDDPSSAYVSWTAARAGATTRSGSVTVGGVTFEARQNGNKTPVFDVNNDGGGDVLAYDPATGAHFFSLDHFSFDATRTLGFDDRPVSPWSTGWSIFAGDFDGNGRSDLFFYNPTTGRAVKAISTGTDVFKYTEFAWSAGWQITIADLNGDGLDDVFVYDPTSGRWFRCISHLDGSFKYTASGVWSPNWSIYAGDFNGDGRADLFLYNTTSDANHGRWYRMLSTAVETFTAIAGEVVWRNDWTITRGDFDGDGRTDLFLYRSTGDYYRVFFRPTGTVYDSGVWSPGWTIASGDFNGDGRTDLFTYNATTGRWYVVISDARGTLSYFGGSTNWSPGWQVTVTDLNVDGVADLVLYNPTDGRWFQAVTVTPGVFTFANGTWPTGLQIIASRPQAK